MFGKSGLMEEAEIQGKPKKRLLSPSINSQMPECTPKKIKSSSDDTHHDTPNTEAAGISSQAFSEYKNNEVPPTPGKTPPEVEKSRWQVTSGGVGPSRWNDSGISDGKIPPPWAQQLFSMLRGISNAIRAVKLEIDEIRGKLASNATTELQAAENCIHDQQLEFNEDPRPSMMDVDERNEPPRAQYLHERQEPPHAQYLHDCFRTRIGLPPEKRTEVEITTFDGVQVAKAYNRILATWQGYFIELEEHDIVKKDLMWTEHPGDGEEAWISPGLRIFKLIKPDNRRTPRAHRFALRTPSGFNGRCNPLLPNKWYIHAYQARFVVGNWARSLNSRTIAKELRRSYPEYHPRGRDIVANTEAGRIPHQAPNEATSPEQSLLPVKAGTRPLIGNNQTKPILPLPAPTPFVPLPTLNQSYPPLGTLIPSVLPPPATPVCYQWPNNAMTQQQYVPYANPPPMVHQPCGPYISNQYPTWPPPHYSATQPAQVNQQQQQIAEGFQGRQYRPGQPGA